jgi:hypothetical protein
MSNISLIEYTAEEVYQDCNSSDYGKDRSRTDGLLCRLSSNTGCLGEDFEMIGALVWIRTDERRNRLGCEGVFVAMEGDQRRLSAAPPFPLPIILVVLVVLDRPPVLIRPTWRSICVL